MKNVGNFKQGKCLILPWGQFWVLRTISVNYRKELKLPSQEVRSNLLEIKIDQFQETF